MVPTARFLSWRWCSFHYRIPLSCIWHRMTIDEFKSWYSGFCEGIPGSPTALQWSKIRLRVAQLDGNDTSCESFRAAYLPNPVYRPIIENSQGDLSYDSCTAMNALGKYEAKA